MYQYFLYLHFACVVSNVVNEIYLFRCSFKSVMSKKT